MPPNADPTLKIPVPLESWVENMIKAQSAEVSTQLEKQLGQLLEKHKENCSVSDLEREVWGNGKNGLKDEVLILRTDVKTLIKQNEGARGFVADVLKPVLVAVIIAGIFWFMSVRVEGCKGKRVEEKELTSHTPIHPYTLTPTNP